MKALDSIRGKRFRRVIGLISGTSADGVDAALVEVEEAGGFSGLRLIHALSLPYSPMLAERVRSASVLCAVDICDLNYMIGRSFAEAAARVMEEAGLERFECDLIGSHGQTVCHRPGRQGGSTLQVGEAAVIAGRTGIVTVSDFRSADIAAGGEGAPLVPLADFLLLRPARGIRLLLNIGGIANITVLAPDREEVRGFDTGPGNGLIDSAVRLLTDGRMMYDRDGAIARRGYPDEEMLREVLDHPYFRRSPPKSTGLGMFGERYVRELRERHPDMSRADFLATLTHLTAQSIAKEVLGALPDPGSEDVVYIGGGGVHNRYLMEILEEAVRPIKIRPLDAVGVSADYREAVAFAILANETIEGRPGNLPAVTGAQREAVLGKITIPPAG